MAEPFKNLFNKKYVEDLAENITKNYKEFDKKTFINSVLNSSWEEKELKERMRHISATLGDFLPKNYPTALEILKLTFPYMDKDLGLQNMVFQDFVEVFGLEDLEESLAGLEVFTINSSAEFAIRHFIIKHPKKTMEQMKIWAKSGNQHLRRLSSEGCRPRLPWAIALQNFKKDPTPILEILELLKNDPSPYVRKSVANNLNDISKDNPKIVLEISKKWLGKNTNTDKLIKHGLRTLLKAGDKNAMEFFGFSSPKEIEISDFTIEKTVSLGEEIPFSFTLKSKNPLGKIRVEYEVELVRQNGKFGYKVFKILEGDFKEKEKFVKKNHSFKVVTTRKYYNGKHSITLIINGEKYAKKDFILTTNPRSIHNGK